MSRPHGVTVEDVEDTEMGGMSYNLLIAKEPVIDTTNLQVHPQWAALLKEIEHKKHARQIPVPTDSARVIALLWECSEPITYFGEYPGARRDQLRELLSQRLEKGERIRTEVDEDDDDDEEGEYYTPGGGEFTWHEEGDCEVLFGTGEEEACMATGWSTAPVAEKLYRQDLKGFKPDLQTYKAAKEEAFLKGQMVKWDGELVVLDEDERFYANANSLGVMEHTPSKEMVDRLAAETRKEGGRQRSTKMEETYWRW